MGKSAKIISVFWGTLRDIKPFELADVRENLLNIYDSKIEKNNPDGQNRNQREFLLKNGFGCSGTHRPSDESFSRE